MRWAILAAVILAVTAAVAANVLLLSYGADRTDPVGRLSPVANIPAPPSRPSPRPVTTSPADDHGGAGHGADD